MRARPGETLGILGPNGEGKTTLARQITAELLPSSGEIRVFGVDAAAEDDAERGETAAPPGATRTLCGADDREPVVRVRALGVRRFSLLSAAPEDVCPATDERFADGGISPKA